MTSVRWLLIFAAGLFILLATAAVDAFRLRDIPTKVVASESLLKKIVNSQPKCDSCDKPTIAVSPNVVKHKTTSIPVDDKPKIINSVVNKIDLSPKKGVQQIRPGFRIKVFKKGESDSDDDDDDDDEDDDDSGDETEPINDSEDENDDSETNDSDEDDDSEDDNEIVVSSKVVHKIPDGSSNGNIKDSDDDSDEESDAEIVKKVSKDDDEDDDDDDDEDDDDEDDDDDSEDDDDSDEDESDTENSEDENSESEKTDSDSDTDEAVILRKENLKSSIKTVKNILKETSKTSKLPPQSEKKTPVDEVSLKKPDNTRVDSKKESPKISKDIKKIDTPKTDSKKEHATPEPKTTVKEQPKIEVKKKEPDSSTHVIKNEIPTPDVKKQEKQPEIKHEPKTETKKPEVKPEVKKPEIKQETKKIENKPEPVKVKPEQTKPGVKTENTKSPEVLKSDAKPTLQKQDVKKHYDKQDSKAKESHTISPKVKLAHQEKKESAETHVKIEKKVEKRDSIVHDALHRKNLRESDFEDFYTFFPTFAPNFSRIHNPECRRQGQILVRQLKGAKIWPLQMLDSTAKVPSGFLRGNGNQLGDYDQCISTNGKVRLSSGSIVKVVGKYCLAQIDLKPVSEETKLPVHLAQARNFIRSVNTDPGHFIPRFTSLNWGVCLPAACDAPEAEFILRDALRHYNGTIGMRIYINVDPINCYTEETSDDWSDWLDMSTIGTLIFYGCVIVLVTYATINDFISLNLNKENKDETNEEATDNKVEETAEKSEEINEPNVEQNAKNDAQYSFVQAFSLKRTTAKLVKEASAEGDIECIHGIRAMCSIALYVAHKLIPLAMTPFTNRTVLTEMSNSPFSVALRASLLYTDSFLLLSGILTAYHMSQDLDRTGSIPWMKRYIARYLRLTPALFAVLLWYAWISDKIGAGPLWGSAVTQNAELCQSNMWQNLFYVQNFFPFEEMCATHTHQLALDMQLWWLAPISVWMLRSRPTWALGVLGGLHSLTIWLRYSTAQSEHLSLVIYHGISLNQLYRTANLCYSLALHRATPYLAGISLGVLLQQTGKDLSLSKFFFIPGWLVCLYFGTWALYTPAHLAMRDYKYDVSEAAQYAALASVAWSLSLSWIIFACFTGNGGPLNKLLCSKPLVVLSRISYSMYLCQFLIFFYNVGSTRTSTEFTLLSAINIMEFAVVIIISTVITLFLDIPMQGAKKGIMSIEFNFGKKETEGEDENANAKEINEEEASNEAAEKTEEEQVEIDEPIQEDVYEYDDEQLETHHFQIEQDVIYEEEEEEYDPEQEQEQYEGEEEGIYEGDQDTEDKPANEGEEDEDLRDWEWTNGELCYNPRR